MANYVLLERITVGAAGASSVSFNNIPQTGYTDLKVVVSARDTTSGNINDHINITFNGSSSNFTSKYLQGNGSAASSASTSDGFVGYIPDTSATANTFGNLEVYIPNYTSTNYKSYSVDSVQENNSGSAGYAQDTMHAGLWSVSGSGSPITNLGFTAGAGSFAQYSTFSLYALAAVGTTPTKAPKAIGGDIIQTDGTYWYHAFLSSGSFTPQTALSCDVLVVAGGGGGGAGIGGGGGAGGLVGLTSQALAANTAQTVLVGAGGAGGLYTAVGHGVSGSNSQLGSLTAAIGGGGGGRENSGIGLSGGSGGGGYGGNAGAAGGTPTSGQGNAGGAGGTTNESSGGGGGAGAAGGAGGTGVGGNGGVGLSTYSSWGAATSTGDNQSGTYYFAGGGGGGWHGSSGSSGGYGGGGASGSGGSGGAGVDAKPNTGGGGGSATYNGSFYNGGAGGSGLVIVRYAY